MSSYTGQRLANYQKRLSDITGNLNRKDLIEDVKYLLCFYKENVEIFRKDIELSEELKTIINKFNIDEKDNSKKLDILLTGKSAISVAIIINDLYDVIDKQIRFIEDTVTRIPNDEEMISSELG